MSKKSWLLGFLKESPKGTKGKAIFLHDFSWDCGWYWGGGYVGNNNLHCHFDRCFLDVPDVRGHPLGNFVTPWTPKREFESERFVIQNGASLWESLSFFLEEPQYDNNQWWRIKDLFKQFYALQKAAEVFQYGGHCTARGRTEGELNPELAKTINAHIENVIIPLIRKELNKEGTDSKGEKDGK